jgi:hypothetical protein
MSEETIEIKYEGRKWKANRLKSTSYVRFESAYSPNDSMTWSVPDANMDELAWRIYHAKYAPSRLELFWLLSIVDSYRALILLPAKKQRSIARALRQFLVGEDETKGGGE